MIHTVSVGKKVSVGTIANTLSLASLRTCKAMNVAEQAKRTVGNDNREVNMEILSWGALLMKVTILILLKMRSYWKFLKNKVS